MQMQTSVTKAGNDDLAGPIHDGQFQRLALFQMPVDVLKRDGAVVDQDPDRKRETAERHHIDGLAEQ